MVLLGHAWPSITPLHIHISYPYPHANTHVSYSLIYPFFSSPPFLSLHHIFFMHFYFSLTNHFIPLSIPPLHAFPSFIYPPSRLHPILAWLCMAMHSHVTHSIIKLIFSHPCMATSTIAYTHSTNL